MPSEYLKDIHIANWPVLSTLAMNSNSTQLQLRGNTTSPAKARDRLCRLFHFSRGSRTNLRNKNETLMTNNKFLVISPSQPSISKAVKSQIGFLDLPLELRREIYRYCLVRSKVIIFPDDPDKTIDPYYVRGRGKNEKYRALLVVCKQVSAEAISILYSENIFQLHMNDSWEYVLKLRRGFSQEQLSRVRKVQFFADTKGVFYGHLLEVETWAPFLAQLSWVSIIAAGNHHNRSYGEGNALYVKEVKQWTKWLAPAMECFEEYLSKDCYLEIDDNNVKETRAVIETCFGQRYRKVENPDADLLFRRGDYSWQSGYWDDQIEFWFYP